MKKALKIIGWITIGIIGFILGGVSLTGCAPEDTAGNPFHITIDSTVNMTVSDNHTEATGGVHGITGEVVGTTDTQELDNKTLDSSVAKGTWTNSGEWSIPAFTALGTISLNNQILDTNDNSLESISNAPSTGLSITNSSDSPYGNYLTLRHTSTTPEIGDLQRWQFQHRDGDNVVLDWAFFEHQLTNVNSGTEASKFNFAAMYNGIRTLAATLTGDGNFNIKGNFQLPSGYIESYEISPPGPGATDTARIYAVSGGDNLTDLCTVYQDGTVDIFSQEATPLDSPILTYSSGTEVKYKMIKPHPGLIQWVAEYPDGTRFVMREIEYHDYDKIQANRGCDGLLPLDWSVTTESEREIIRAGEVVSDNLTGIEK